MKDFNRAYLNILESLKELSDDTKRKVSSIIVKDGNIISYGVNVIPNDASRNENRNSKELKKYWIEHSERNAIFKCSKQGIALEGSEMYVNYFPCADCSRAIIQCGIKKVYTPKPDLEKSKWKESWKEAIFILTEADVEIVFI
jgi:dCMP deaminase